MHAKVIFLYKYLETLTNTFFLKHLLLFPVLELFNQSIKILESTELLSYSEYICSVAFGL
jgi:hypothetical protein